MSTFNPSRRAFMGSAATGLASIALASAANANDPRKDTFPYEVTRTEKEWRAKLTKDEYNILRKGGTELPKTSELWNNTADGVYSCKGCDLQLYDSKWKVPVDMGWVFFRQSRPNSLLMGIDGLPAEYNITNGPPSMIEVHCRRCGSHMGHILRVKEDVLNCIDGTSLTFQPAAT